MSQINSDTTNAPLHVIPELVNFYLDEKDHRQFACTDRYHNERKKNLPAKERFCVKEFNELCNNEVKSTLSSGMQQSPMLRNFNYTGQNALVKALLLQSLINSSLEIQCGNTNFQTIMNIYGETLRCVLKSINYVKIHPTVDVQSLAEIIRIINTNGLRTLLDLSLLPHDYFIYSMTSTFWADLNIPTCNIRVLCFPGVWKTWSETRSAPST